MHNVLKNDKQTVCILRIAFPLIVLFRAEVYLKWMHNFALRQSETRQIFKYKNII